MAQAPDQRSDKELLRRISRSAGARAGYKQLIRELGLGGGRERRLLVEQLSRMVARGELSNPEQGLWSIPARKDDQKTRTHTEGDRSQTSETPRHGRERLVSGRLDLHRDGFGFVRLESGKGQESPGAKGDLFIPPGDMNGAMQGDLVLVDEAPPGRDGRRSGRIARVLTRRNLTLVGIFHHGAAEGRSSHRPSPFGNAPPRGNYVLPLDEKLGGPIEIPEGEEAGFPGAAVHNRTLQSFGKAAKHAEAANQVEQDPPGEGSRAGSEATAPERRGSSALSLEADGTEGALRSVSRPDQVRSLEGMAVDVEVLSFPQAGRPARGRVIEVLGRPDDFGVDTEIVIRKHHLPHVFPADVLREAGERAQYTSASVSREELAAREDFRSLPIVTIDGETARDFDDAVLVRPLSNGHTELQVHIADVSSYVLPGSPLDLEARVRGTSVYFPDRAVPMLPHALSSGMCSLKPGEDRFVLSCLMEIDSQGEIENYRVVEGLIRSARRFTYTSVQHCLNASPEAHSWNAGRRITPETAAEDLAERERVALEQPELPSALDRMLQVALLLNRKRVRRGSIDFDLPEPVVRFDPDGNMKAIVKSERGWAHRLIEEFMLSANECVATWLEAQGIPSIYRIHEMPDPKRIVEFEETAASFGQSLGIGALPVRRFTMKTDRRAMTQRASKGQDRGHAQAHDLPERIPVTPRMYQRLVRHIAGKPEERILAYLMLRSLKQARYAEKNEGHFALASPSYTHFTSPIRRYPDLIVHRLLRDVLRRGADPHGGPIRSDDAQPWDVGFPDGAVQLSRNKSRPEASSPSAQGEPLPAAELEDIATESSQAERRAADAERELIEWKKMKFMADKVGDDFRGIILSVTKYGFFVELDELFIEGLVPLASLTGDFYSFRDTDRTICGARSGHSFAVGQRVEVILDRIDRQQRKLQFALLPGTEPTGNNPARTAVSLKKQARPKAITKVKASGKRKRR